MPQWLSVFTLLLSLTLGGLLQSASAVAGTEPVYLDSGWQYRWGDSPFTSDGVPLWTRESADDQWRDIDFPANPPERQGQENIWYRVTLPDGQWREPVLYVSSIDLIVQVYLEDKLIYSHGEFDAQGRGEFAGWPWHMIQLPPDSAGKPLYFRIFSDYLDIGLWGEVKVMEHAALLEEVVVNSIEGIAIGGFSLFLTLLAILFACTRRNCRMFVAIALYALASGAVVVAKSPISLLLWKEPLAWDFIGAMGYFALPVAMGLLLEHWFQPPLSDLYRRVWRFFLIFLVGAALVALPGWVMVTTLYPIFDLLFTISLPLLFAPAFRSLDRYTTEQKAILSALAVLSGLLLVDMGVAHDILPWVRVPVAWGSFAFLLAVIVISLRYFTRAQRELAELNRSLEQQVQARTAELERLSYEDPLTGLKNRRFFNQVLEREIRRAERESQPLSLMICDLDEFKQFNDSHGHAAGDEALRHVAKVLKQVFRQSDLICRYGGEEFVVILPGADSQAGLHKAEQLRSAIATSRVVFDQQSLGPITLSVGVASWPEEQGGSDALLAAADDALYRAKRTGRDRVELAGNGEINPV